MSAICSVRLLRDSISGCLNWMPSIIALCGRLLITRYSSRLSRDSGLESVAFCTSPRWPCLRQDLAVHVNGHEPLIEILEHGQVDVAKEFITEHILAAKDRIYSATSVGT